MAADLHSSLGPAPDAKPVCCACSTANEQSILVPLNKTTFICSSCAGAAYASAVGEHLRRVCELLLDIDPFSAPQPSRSLQ